MENLGIRIFLGCTAAALLILAVVWNDLPPQKIARPPDPLVDKLTQLLRTMEAQADKQCALNWDVSDPLQRDAVLLTCKTGYMQGVRWAIDELRREH